MKIIAMTLTVGDMAALLGMMATLTTVSGIVVRYFVKSEIKTATDALRLELAKDRIDVLESRSVTQTPDVATS